MSNSTILLHPSFFIWQVFFLEMIPRVLQFRHIFFLMAYTISRDEASKMLGVSTRTIDRYIAAGKIRSKRE